MTGWPVIKGSELFLLALTVRQHFVGTIVELGKIALA